MTLRRSALASSPAARTTGAVLALLALVGLGIATADTEAVVAGRFAAALEAPAQTADKAAADRKVLVSGSEAYWLSEKRRLTADGASLKPAAWAAPLAAGLSVGDRITVPGEKSERVLQVVAIADLETAPGVATTTGSSAQKVAVTCRDLSTPDGRLVTFLVPSETPTRSAHAL